MGHSNTQLILFLSELRPILKRKLLILAASEEEERTTLGSSAQIARLKINVQIKECNEECEELDRKFGKAINDKYLRLLTGIDRTEDPAVLDELKILNPLREQINDLTLIREAAPVTPAATHHGFFDGHKVTPRREGFDNTLGGEGGEAEKREALSKLFLMLNLKDNQVDAGELFRVFTALKRKEGIDYTEEENNAMFASMSVDGEELVGADDFTDYFFKGLPDDIDAFNETLAAMREAIESEPEPESWYSAWRASLRECLIVAKSWIQEPRHRNSVWALSTLAVGGTVALLMYLRGKRKPLMR